MHNKKKVHALPKHWEAKTWERAPGSNPPEGRIRTDHQTLCTCSEKSEMSPKLRVHETPTPDVKEDKAKVVAAVWGMYVLGCHTNHLAARMI